MVWGCYLLYYLCFHYEEPQEKSVSDFSANQMLFSHGQHESLCSVTQPCPTLCDPMDCSPPGSSVHGFLQARSGVGCHFLLQGGLPDTEIESRSLALQADSLLSEPPSRWGRGRGGWRGHKSLLYLTKIPEWLERARWGLHAGDAIEGRAGLCPGGGAHRPEGKKGNRGQWDQGRWCYRSGGGSNLASWAGSVKKASWRKQPLGKARSWVSWVRVERKGKVVISVEGTAQQGGESVSKGQMFSCLQTSTVGCRFSRSACYYVPPPRLIWSSPNPQQHRMWLCLETASVES